MFDYQTGRADAHARAFLPGMARPSHGGQVCWLQGALAGGVTELACLVHSWLLATQRGGATGNGTGKAVEHALKRWPALVRYADSGTLPIDNNAVENAIRPIAIGKKNWLFAGSERAGWRAAAIQTLLGTAKLNGLNPLHWLASALERLPTCPSNQIGSLPPFPNSTQP